MIALLQSGNLLLVQVSASFAFAIYNNKDLGWARKHGKDGIDKSPEGNSKYSISLDGSRYNPDFQNLRARIHVYGDSFAFCRLVNDNETEYYVG